MSTPLIDAAAVQAGPAGRLVAHYFKKFIDEAPVDVIAKDLPGQSRIFMHGFEPKTQEFVTAGPKIHDMLAHHAAVQLLEPKRPHRAQQAAEEPEHMKGSEIAATAVSAAVAAPFHALQSILGLGALAAVGSVNALRNDGKNAAERSDSSASTLTASINALSEKPAGAGQQQVGEAKTLMQTAAADYARSMIAESKDIIAKAKSGSMTQQDVRNAIESRAAKTDALLADAEKAAAAAKNPEPAEAIAKTVERVRIALEQVIEAIMKMLKSFSTC
jgi:hypothetical protein